MKIPKVEIQKGWAERIINSVLWGDSTHNTNEIDIASDDKIWSKNIPKPEGVKEEQPY